MPVPLSLRNSGENRDPENARSTNLPIKQRKFESLVSEVALDNLDASTFQKHAIYTLQVAAKYYLVQPLENENLIAWNALEVTIHLKNINVCVGLSLNVLSLK